MGTKNYGEPAFPGGAAGPDGDGSRWPYYPGMSLRDWFAGMAMQELIACYAHAQSIGSLEYVGVYYEAASVSEAAYRYADAMLVERDKEAGNVE